jgi:hypothetical protein
VGTAQGLDPSGTHPWEAGWRYSGRRSRQIFEIWEDVFGNTNRFVRVIASQTNSYVTDRKLETDSAYLYCDAVAIAPYFGGRFNDAARLADIATWSVDRLLDSCLADIRGGVRQGIQDHIDLCDRYNTQHGTDLKLIAYEGGQHLSAWNRNQDATDLFTAANRAPRMKDLYITYFEMWDTLGGTLFCQFSSLCSPGPYGAWCVLETVDQDPLTAPKYQALLELIAAHPAPLVSVRDAAVRPGARVALAARPLHDGIGVTSSSGGTATVLRPDGRVVVRAPVRPHAEALLAPGAARGAYLVRLTSSQGVRVSTVVLE